MTFQKLIAAALAVFGGLFVPVVSAADPPPQTASFTYVGELSQDGNRYTGRADLLFSLWSDSTGGRQVAPPVRLNGVTVKDGIVRAPVEFPRSAIVDADDIWLEVAIRAPAGEGAFITLSPRQRATSSDLAADILNPADVQGAHVRHHLLPAGDRVITSEASMRLNIDGNNDSTNAVFEVARDRMGETGGTVLLKLLEDGNFGIGTVSPSQPLDVLGDAHAGGGDGGGAHDGNAEFISIRGQSDTWFLSALNRSAEADTDFFVGLSDTDVDRFRFRRNGFLGLGTNPSSNLQVASGASVRMHLEADTDNSNEADQPSILFSQDDGLVSAEIGYFDATNDFRVRTINSSALFLQWQPNQRLEMGEFDGTDSTRHEVFGVSNDGAPIFAHYGGNERLNVLISHLNGSPNNGWVSVANSAEVSRAGAFIDGSNRGTVWGDVKSFRAPNPADPQTEIWYACIEGPEAAAYVRGTATLREGVVTVPLPQHFQDVATEAGMTVLLTPRSAESKGLAVVERAPDHFVVRELMNGTGTYEFDWEVKSVRRGFEDYEVIRPIESAQPALPFTADGTGGM